MFAQTFKTKFNFVWRLLPAHEHIKLEMTYVNTQKMGRNVSDNTKANKYFMNCGWLVPFSCVSN